MISVVCAFEIPKRQTQQSKDGRDEHLSPPVAASPTISLINRETLLVGACVAKSVLKN
jgi:hypothetical protein